MQSSPARRIAQQPSWCAPCNLSAGLKAAVRDAACSAIRSVKQDLPRNKHAPSLHALWCIVCTLPCGVVAACARLAGMQLTCELRIVNKGVGLAHDTVQLLGPDVALHPGLPGDALCRFILARQGAGSTCCIPCTAPQASAPVSVHRSQSPRTLAVCKARSTPMCAGSSSRKLCHWLQVL